MVRKEAPVSIEFEGVTYRRSPNAKGNARLYYRGRRDGRSVSLHRAIWEAHHGPIPPGYHVHHRDGNPLNNSIENLECLTPSAHVNGHLDKRHAAIRAERAANPPPRRPTTASGKLHLRLPVEMHPALVAEAEREGVSLNTLIVTLLAGAIGWTATRRPRAKRPQAGD